MHLELAHILSTVDWPQEHHYYNTDTTYYAYPFTVTRRGAAARWRRLGMIPDEGSLIPIGYFR